MTSLIKIPAGGMYQEWMKLIDIVAVDTAKMLNEMAVKNDWREVQPNEAINMGFEELVEWSQPETDILVFISNYYLVCLPKHTLLLN